MKVNPKKNLLALNKWSRVLNSIRRELYDCLWTLTQNRLFKDWPYDEEVAFATKLYDELQLLVN